MTDDLQNDAIPATAAPGVDEAATTGAASTDPAVPVAEEGSEAVVPSDDSAGEEADTGDLDLDSEIPEEEDDDLFEDDEAV